MEKKRSKGVTIFAILFLIWAVWELIYFISYQNKTPFISSMFSIEILLSAITGIGALLLLEWTRKIIIIYALASIAIAILFYDSLLKLFGGRVTTTDIEVKTLASHMTVIARILWRMFIIYFFARPKIKEQFK